jgi:competence protein ComEC
VPDIFYVILFTFLILLCFCCKKQHFLIRSITFYAIPFLMGATYLLWQGVTYQSVWRDNGINTTEFFVQSHQVTGNITSLVVDDIKLANVKHNDIKLDNVKSNNIKNNKIKPGNIKKSTRFNFLVESIDQQPINQPFMVRLSWQKAPKKLHQHQKWQFYVKLKPAHGLANQGGFSYQVWLRQHQLVATGYVTKQSQSLLENTLSLRQQWFEKFNQQITKYTSEHENLSHINTLLMALTFGVRDGLTPDNWHILKVTGTQHLIAISGLHIGLVASGVFALMQLFLRILPLRLLSIKLQGYITSYNSTILAIVISCLAAIFYSYLAGFSPPTVRALVMLLIFWLLKLFALHFTRTRWLLLTVFIIIIFNPLSLLSLSFWLSLYAVTIIFILLWLYDVVLFAKQRWLRYLKSLLFIQLGLTFFILPISVLLQYQVSFVSLFANLFAVPWLSVVVLPLSLITAMLSIIDTVFFASFLSWSQQSLLVLWQWLAFWAEQSWAVVDIELIDVVLFMFIVCCGCWLLLAQHQRRLYLLLCVFIVACVHHYSPTSWLNDANKQPWVVTVLDVGQGLAVVVKKGQQVIVYDTGASYPSGFNMADAVITPFLKSQGIFTIDRLYFSHSDNDHAGGFKQLQQSFTIKSVIGNDKKFKANKKCIAPSIDTWQGLNVEVLSPLLNSKHNLLGDQSNDDSCVLKIYDAYHQVLLTGDISKKIEKKLIEQAKNNNTTLKAAVLIAPHHGSNTSSTSAFIAAVGPTYTVFSAGFLNRWHMPTKQVVERYEKLNISTYTTAMSGSISFVFSLDTVSVVEYRKQQYPFWFAN